MIAFIQKLIKTLQNEKKLLFILIFAFGLTSCDLLKVGDSDTDKEPELPPITTTGENTFGAIVNGEIRVVTSFVKLTAIHQVSDIIDIGGGFFDRDRGIDQRIEIRMTNELIKEGDFQFDSNSDESRFFSFRDENTGCLYKKNFDENTSFQGQLSILKLDKVNRTISGTFSFIINLDGCPEVKVEQGRFDLKYID
ncbi:hypothetical protein [uncultured Roseivirga sp.]|uniref:hypothetical protein n=1 Tax=uncultured Roseivirga sp. TaxID=543088 RepID=UPI0025907AE9|nr:hypothetical protein [uncultured Roseivirga sp.]